MQTKWKRMLACFLAMSMMASAGSIVVNSEGDKDAAGDKPAASDKEETGESTVSDDFVARTEQQVLDSMIVAAENDKLIFYVWDYENATEDAPVEDIFALKNKETGYIWWSSPFNAGGDPNATPTLRKELASALTIEYGDPKSRSTSYVRSGDPSRCAFSYSSITDGVKVTYNFRKAGIQIPVEYTLKEDYLSVRINTEKITEKNTSEKLLTSIKLLTAFGAGDSEAEGYFVVPDGSGARINFNNGKTNASVYAQRVYGKDITAVPTTKGAVTEQVYLPMYGIVRDDNALMVVADKGDSNAQINAAVSGQSKSSYNLCNFQFILRSTDTFYMGGDTTPLTVFESGSIKTKEIAVRYYPVADTAGTTDYVDVAAAYRNYLTTDGGVTPKVQPNASDLYVDIYGGVEKSTNILGIPVTLKTAMTDFDQTREIISSLKDRGVDDMVVALNNWTNAGIAGKVDYKAKAAGVLGGKSDFQDLTKYLSDNGIAYYPTVNNKKFYSGQGFFAFTDTAIRVSGSYSRIISYERAFGTPDSFKDTISLLSPSNFSEIYSDLTDNYSKAGITGVSIGEMTSLLYGDYGKKAISRDDMKNIMTDSLSGMQKGVGSVLADTANAYALPYVDHVTNVPLSSSGFDVIDEDLPLYQLVMHGVLPYATTAINGSADSERLLLQAIATGSNLHFDLLHEETSELKDTDFDIYYYAHYANWLDTAAQEYKLASTVTGAVSDQTIVDYIQQDDVITTTYANGTVTTVNLKTGQITCNGTSYALSDYVEEGGLLS